MIPQGALPLQDSIEMLQADARIWGMPLCLLVSRKKVVQP